MSDKEISASEFEEIFNDEARHEEHDQQLNDISECSNGICFMDDDTEDVADEDVAFVEGEFDDEELEEEDIEGALMDELSDDGIEEEEDYD